MSSDVEGLGSAENTWVRGRKTSGARNVGKNNMRFQMSQKVISIGLLVLLFALIASIVVLSAVPPVSKDELVHHLAVPKLYLKHGGMYEIPFMPFSYYPMNLDLLY